MKAAVREWLLDGGAQLAKGPERGAVIGWLDEAGEPAFAYPEAAGYYLTCLAFMATVDGRVDRDLRARAARAIRWLAAVAAHGDPPTRVPLVPASAVSVPPQAADWRADGVFAFDLAMVVRGIDAISGIMDVSGTPDARRLYVARLSALAPSRHGLPACRPRRGVAPERIPRRWSTEPGPFLLKAAAALTVAPTRRVARSLARAAHRTAGRWRGPWPTRHRRELHPLLYALEGLFLLGLARADERAWTRAETGYRWLMAAQAPDGALPARLDDPWAPPRSDVTAQALRLGCALRAVGRLPEPGWDARLDALAACVHRAIRADGAVAFTEGAPRAPVHWNAWCAMFAFQALAFHDAWRRDGRIERRWLALLI